MAALAWEESIRTGVPEIDRQHQMILERLDFLDQAIREGQGEVVIGQILTDLTEYAREHFRTEERYFEQCGYPKRDSHHQEHDRFIHDIGELYEAFDSGKTVSPDEVYAYLRNWIEQHLWVVDREYLPFLGGSAGARKQ
ncbi:MAG TPA: bacteriohemerythrin [Rectinemataceae bacterium]|nr:bacteriohemerythrin [Rectinemataceae bacterium]